MSLPRIVTLSLVAMLLVPATSVAYDVATPTAVHAAVATAERDAAVQRILADTNASRAAEGLPALVLNPQVSAVAQSWTDRLASSGTLSHNPDYSTQIPAGWTSAAENVAYGYSPSTVTSAWMGSSGHRANILGGFTDIGIGYQVDTAGRGWFTQNFAQYPVRSLTATPVPRMSGTADAGKTLTAVAGTWSPAPVTLEYQWRRQGVDIPGAVGVQYVVVPDDVGKSLTVTVTGSKSGYSPATRTSSPVTARYALTSTPTPTLTGTPRVGSLLTANAGTWTPSPVTQQYQWKRGGIPITGATARTYLLTSADRGQIVTVSVTGSKAGYRTITTTSAGLLIAG